MSEVYLKEKLRWLIGQDDAEHAITFEGFHARKNAGTGTFKMPRTDGGLVADISRIIIHANLYISVIIITAVVDYGHV